MDTRILPREAQWRRAEALGRRAVPPTQQGESWCLPGENGPPYSAFGTWHIYKPAEHPPGTIVRLRSRASTATSRTGPHEWLSRWRERRRRAGNTQLRASPRRSVEKQIRDPDQNRRTNDRADDYRPGPDAINQERRDVVHEKQNDCEADDAQDLQDDDANLRPARDSPIVAHSCAILTPSQAEDHQRRRPARPGSWSAWLSDCEPQRTCPS